MFSLAWSLRGLRAEPMSKHQLQCTAGCNRDPVAELQAVLLHTRHVAKGIQLCGAGNSARLGRITRLRSRK